MNLNESIRRILREETELKTEKLKTLVQQIGVEYASKMVGGIINLVNILYDGDFKNFYRENNYVPYRFDSTGENMYIDEMLIQTFNLEDDSFNKDKKLGDFRWTSGGINFKFTAYASKPFKSRNQGQELRKVVGRSGDSGFGYSFILKRNTLGKRARKQIFQQIIDKYNLNSYL